MGAHLPGRAQGGITALGLLPGGGAAVVGVRAAVAVEVPDPFLLVGNEKAEKAWDATFSETAVQVFDDVAVLASGRLLAVGGVRTSFDQGLYDGWIVVSEPGGELVTKRVLGRSGWSHLHGATGIWDGGAVAVGRSGSTMVSGRGWVGPALVVRLNADGKTVWEKTLGERVVAVTDVIEVKGGTMFAATKLEQNNRLSSSLVTVDHDGNDTWQPIQMGADLEVKDLAATPSGGLALLGRRSQASRQIWIGVSGPR